MNKTAATLDSQTVKTGPRSQLKWGFLAAMFFAVVTSLPQIYVYLARGSEWNGSCAYLDTDELPYAAYTNALIDGRPRRNDPYTAKDNGPFETLFSIQFLPPYVLAVPARLLGLSAHTAFIILLPLATAGAVLMVWWLLFEITRNSSLAAVGAIGVFSLGTAAAHSPILIFQGIVTGYDFFPFLRRYIPALPFPLFIAFSYFIWRALTKHPAWAVLASVTFALLVYSYFFLWTSAAAWSLTIAAVWFLARPNDRARVGLLVGLLILVGGIALVPYFWLLTQRANITDSAQLLELSRAPDLFRAPELYGALVLIALLYYARKRPQGYREPKILFAVSFLLAPFLVFNQQILTGRSLQPFHYEEFATNYWVVLAAFLSLGILRSELPRRVTVYLAVATIGIAIWLGVMATRRTLNSNVRFDEAWAVALKLRENPAEVVFASDFRLTNSIATTSRNPVLWSRHMYTFSNVDSAEQKKRYFQHLYYSGFDESQMLRALNTDFFARWEVFGAARANPILTLRHNPITEPEIINAATEYAAFVKSYDSARAADPVLSYAIVSPGSNLSNLDAWYVRVEMETIGKFVIYRLTLKSPN